MLLASITFIGLVGSLVTIYSVFIEKKHPALVFQVLSDTEVIDQKEKIKGLKVMFEGSNVDRENTSLKSMVVQISNSGNMDILPTFFQPNEKWGFKLSPARLIDVQIIDSNSLKLKEAIYTFQRYGESVEFLPVIFESGKYVNIKILFFSKKGISNELSYFGKIAGIESVEIITKRITTTSDFFEKVYSGNIKIQFLRIFIYPIFLLLSLVGVAVSFIPFLAFYEYTQKSIRKARVGKIRSEGLADFENFEFASELYIEAGKSSLSMARKIIDHEMPNARPFYDVSLAGSSVTAVVPFVEIENIRELMKKQKLSPA